MIKIKRMLYKLGAKARRSEYSHKFYHKITNQKHGNFTNKKSEICIEGYQSSGNTFVYNSLVLAGGGGIEYRETQTCCCEYKNSVQI